MSMRAKKSRGKRWECISVPAIDELELLADDVIEKQSLPEGFCVRFFCHDMRYLYTVASPYVKLTRGVLDYLHDYNQLGPNKSRNKLFLCSQYNKEGKCLNGAYCREIHCTLPIERAEDAEVYGVPSNATGAPNVIKLVDGKEIVEKALNRPLQLGTGNTPLADTAKSPFSTEDVPTDPATTHSVFDSIFAGGIDSSAPMHTLVTPLSVLEPDEPVTPSAPQTVISMPRNVIVRHSLHSRWTSKTMYKTLPGGVAFHVALPNTPTPVDQYDSSELFVTRGAQEYYDQQKRGEPSTVTMQHCAHYSKNGICCFGEDCQFVHVLHYRAKDRDVGDGSCSEMDMSISSGSVATDRRSSAGRSRRNKEAPLCIQVPNVPGGSGHTAHTSGSSVNARNSGSGSNGTTSAVGTPVNQSNANCVVVPNSAQWVAQQQQLLLQSGSLGPQPSQQQSLPPPPPFNLPNMQKPMMYQSTPPSTPLVGLLQLQQHQQQQQQQQQQGQFTVVQGPNGEFFVVPSVAQGSTNPSQLNTATLSSLYMNMLPTHFNS